MLFKMVFVLNCLSQSYQDEIKSSGHVAKAFTYYLSDYAKLDLPNYNNMYLKCCSTSNECQ